jgi:hypothetical protein
VGRSRQAERQQEPEQQRQPAEEAALVAAAVALIAATGLAQTPAIERVSEAVIGLMPAGAVRGMQVARLVARLSIEEIPIVDSVGFARAAQLDRLMWRVAYMRASAARLLAGLAKGVAIETLIASETRFFELHLRMNARRLFGARDVLEAMDKWGEVLSWRITVRPTNRPYHRTADRHNWRPLLGPPIDTLAYPGVLDNCLCFSGPPIAGAPFLSQIGSPLAA